MPNLRVEVWSDIACPWCYVGRRRLEKAIAKLPPRHDVEVVRRAFELDPAAPPAQPGAASYAERLARKYGTAVAQAEQMIARMTAVGAAEGLDLRFDRVRPGNTFDAHRVLRLARERGVQDAVEERLFRAYFSEGEAIGDRDVLARVASEAGLDRAEVRRALASDRYAEAVRADEAEAQRSGIGSVPFFVLGGEYGIPGAQPVEILHEALLEAMQAAPAPEPRARVVRRTTPADPPAPRRSSAKRSPTAGRRRGPV